MIKRSWVEIDLDTIASNYQIYKKTIGPSQRLMAVVKADAYGHGAIEVAKRLQELACKDFAVSNIDEAIELRKAGIDGQILILGYTPISSIADLIKYDLTQTLLSEEYAEALKDKGIKAQFAIDTGMNRIGLDGDDLLACVDTIRQYYSSFKLTGLFTHLCVADSKDGEEFTIKQIDKFKEIVDNVTDLNLEYIHCMNTAGGLFYPRYGNMVRLGISLYGLKPDISNTIPDGIKPALKWKSIISMIKDVYPEETIGYGRTYKADKQIKVATIPTGYADGYNRKLSNKGTVYINGQKAKILGRVCMDQLMVDVTGLNVKFEDEVELIGDNYTAEDMANDIETIGYEVICDIGKRVNRIYNK